MGVFPAELDNFLCRSGSGDASVDVSGDVSVDVSADISILASTLPQFVRTKRILVSLLECSLVSGSLWLWLR